MCCSVLQCVAVCCSVWQCVAESCLLTYVKRDPHTVVEGLGILCQARSVVCRSHCVGFRV